MNVDLIEIAILRDGNYDASHLKTIEQTKIMRTMFDRGIICSLQNGTITLVEIDSTKIK